jgi:drug/metabolite transporter (DMT)-like permease
MTQLPINARKEFIAGIFITLTGAILFSTKAIIVKLTFRDTSTDALSLLTLRMLFASPFYFIAAWWISRKSPPLKMNRRQYALLFFYGICGYYLSSLFDFLGLQYISAGLERLILFLYPSFAVLLNATLFKQKVLAHQRWALVLTYFGIGLAFFGEVYIDAGNPYFYLGSLLVFLCAVTYAFYLVGNGRMIPIMGAGRFTAYSILIATGGIFLHYLIRGDYSLFQAPAITWKYGLILAVIGTVIPTFLISLGMKKIGSNNAAIVSSIGPVSTILQAHYVLGEPIFAEQLIGTALVVTGVLVLGWKMK